MEAVPALALMAAAFERFVMLLSFVVALSMYVFCTRFR
jgi:hypothetical protein